MADGDVRGVGVRKAVSVLERPQLEDKHLRLMEENLLLKKHARSQEEKIKKMATKLLRLTADERREAKRDGQVHPRNLELEEVVDELQGRNRDLERHNSSLKSKVQLLRQQLESRAKRHTPYDHIPARISTGLAVGKKAQRAQSSEDLSSGRQSSGIQATASPALPRYGHSLLEEARRDNQELEELVLQLKEEVALLSAQGDRSREELKLKEAEFAEDRLKLQERLQAQLTAVQKSNIQEDVELIKLQRELREKSSRLLSLQSQYLTLEKNLEVMKVSHAKVLQETESLNARLKEEQRHSSSLQLELKASAVSQRAVSELQEMVADLRSEKELLKQTNDRLMRNAMDGEREQEHRLQLKALQDRARRLEAASKTELSEKARVLEKLSRERELSERLDQELKEVRATYHQLRDDHEELQQRMKFFLKESSVDWGEIEEALAQVRAGKAGGRGREELEPLSFLEKVDSEEGDQSKALQRELLELQAAHADTINELEKTRKLLSLQQTINNDCKREIDSLQSRLSEQSQNHAGRLQEYAQLLDIKSARVKKLEAQLREIAYGTQHYKLDTTKFEFGGEDEVEPTVELERGQNLLQFHITQVLLSSEALSFLNAPNPSLFVTLGFQDYEMQVTPVVQGPRPLFGHTSNFVVTITEEFLHQLNKGCVSVELHQAFGMKYKTLAAGSVKCRELITNTGGKVHGKIMLTGVGGLQECVNVGSLEYWMRLKLPVTQSVRLYQERSKAVSLISPHTSTLPPTSDSADGEPATRGVDYNELTVTVVRCSGLQPQDHGHAPSSYVMYKFYTFPDHDTPIVSGSSDPAFNDVESFPLSMDKHLHQYLSTEALELYVFDDLDPVETNYLGAAHISLLPLTQDTPISVSLQLIRPSGESAGELEVSLRWMLPYRARVPASSPAPPSHPPPILASRELQSGAIKSDGTQPVKSVTETKKHPGGGLSPPKRHKRDENLKKGGNFDSNLMTQESEGAAIQPCKETHTTELAIEGSDHATTPESDPLTASGSSSHIVPPQTTRLESPDSFPHRLHVPPPSKPLVLPALAFPDRSGTKSLDTESEFSDVTPLSSLGASGLSQELKSSLPPLALPTRPGVSRGKTASVPGNQEDDYVDSVDVSVTEVSDDEEEIEEELSEDEDTMFEETLTQPEDSRGFSPLSPHPGSDLRDFSPPRGGLVEREGETDSPELTLEPNDGKPVTSQAFSTGDGRGKVSTTHADTMVITVASFSPTPDSSLLDDVDITQLFVEYQFLDFDYGELETESQPVPAVGKAAVFNYRKVFRLESEQKALLAAMLEPGDPSEGRLQFTLVSDPEGSEADCTEIGSAEVDLNTVLQGGDLVDHSIEVISVESEELDVVGHLVVSVEAADLLRQLMTR